MSSAPWGLVEAFGLNLSSTSPNTQSCFSSSSYTWGSQLHSPINTPTLISKLSVPGGAGGKEPAYQCRRHKRRGFDPWVGKIPWKRVWQPTPILLPGESPWTEEPGRLQSIELQSQTRQKRLSTQTHRLGLGKQQVSTSWFWSETHVEKKYSMSACILCDIR